MAKPRERNRAMRAIADDALDAELEALKRKRGELSRLGILLDDMRWAAERFRDAAQSFCDDHHMPRAQLVRTLKMEPRETGMAFHAVTPDYGQTNPADSHGEIHDGEDSSLESDDRPASTADAPEIATTEDNAATGNAADAGDAGESGSIGPGGVAIRFPASWRLRWMILAGYGR